MMDTHLAWNWPQQSFLEDKRDMLAGTSIPISSIFPLSPSTYRKKRGEDEQLNNFNEQTKKPKKAEKINDFQSSKGVRELHFEERCAKRIRESYACLRHRAMHKRCPADCPDRRIPKPLPVATERRQFSSSKLYSRKGSQLDLRQENVAAKLEQYQGHYLQGYIADHRSSFGSFPLLNSSSSINYPSSVLPMSSSYPSATPMSSSSSYEHTDLVNSLLYSSLSDGTTSNESGSSGIFGTSATTAAAIAISPFALPEGMSFDGLELDGLDSGNGWIDAGIGSIGSDGNLVWDEFNKGVDIWEEPKRQQQQQQQPKQQQSQKMLVSTATTIDMSQTEPFAIAAKREICDAYQQRSNPESSSGDSSKESLGSIPLSSNVSDYSNPPGDILHSSSNREAAANEYKFSACSSFTDEALQCTLLNHQRIVTEATDRQPKKTQSFDELNHPLWNAENIILCNPVDSSDGNTGNERDHDELMSVVDMPADVNSSLSSSPIGTSDSFFSSVSMSNSSPNLLSNNIIPTEHFCKLLPRILLTRNNLERWHCDPVFNGILQGFFVRVRLGGSKNEKSEHYVARIIEGRDFCYEMYKVGRIETTKGLLIHLVDVGNSSPNGTKDTTSSIPVIQQQHIVPLEAVSNKYPQDSELELCRRILESSNFTLSMEEVKEKMDLFELMNSKYQTLTLSK